MDFQQCLSGPELEKLYLRDKTNACLTNPENINSLLSYILNKEMEELTKSDLEILDFCNARIHPEGFPDDKKLQFMHDKYNYINKEKKKRFFFR